MLDSFYFRDVFKTFETFEIRLPFVKDAMRFLLVDCRSEYLATTLTRINSICMGQKPAHVGYLAFNRPGATNYKNLSFILYEDPSYAFNKLAMPLERNIEWIGALFCPIEFMHHWLQVALITRRLEYIGDFPLVSFQYGFRPTDVSSFMDHIVDADRWYEYVNIMNIARANILTGLESGRYSKPTPSK